MGKSLWNELSEKAKEVIITEYSNIQEDIRKSGGLYSSPQKDLLEKLFGKKTLKSKLPIRRWEDVEVQGYDCCCYTEVDCEYLCLKGWDVFGKDVQGALGKDIKLIYKLQATLKIAKLIELGYGGMVTNEEWKDVSTEKYTIEVEDGFLRGHIRRTLKVFIAFHTKELREEFLKYNERLCKEYYMI